MRGIEAERNLQASITLTRALSEFIIEHKEWPNTDKDLLEGCRYDGVDFSWPNDAAAVLKRVSYHAGVSLDDIVQSEPDSFAFITPQEPIYRKSYVEKVRQLLEVAKKIHHENKPVNQDARGNYRE